MSPAKEISRKSCRVLIQEIHNRKYTRIQKLLQGGADVNGTDHNRVTPLHHAVKSRNIDIVRLLLDHGADVNAEDDCGYRPYNIALNDNFVEALEVLLQDNAVITELEKSASRLPSHMVDRFYDKVDLQFRNYKGHTALHVVTVIDDLRAVRRLLDRGAEVGVESSYEEETPLHLVVSRDMAELLLDYGAPIDARDRYSVTPLSEVAMTTRKRMTRSEQTKIIELLIGRGAELPVVLFAADLQIDYMRGIDEKHGLKDVLKFVALKEHEHGLSKSIGRAEFRRFYDQALAEVDEMKDTEFYCKVSYHEFLLKSWQRRTSYIDDVRVAKVAGVEDIDARFSLYREILGRHVNAARKRNELREKAATVVAHLCPRLGSVSVVVGKVMEFLERKDMEVLVGAFCR